MWKYYIPIVGIGIMFSNWTKFSENDPTGIHWAMTAFWQSIWTTVILIICYLSHETNKDNKSKDARCNS